MSRKCFVTGGSTGIGRAIVEQFAREGYDVAFVHLDDDENAASLVRQVGLQHLGQCFAKSIDLSTDDGPMQAAEFARQRLGRVDVLVNNAGVTRLESVLDLTESTLQYLFALNYRAPLILTREIASCMIADDIRGSVIFTASTRGYRAYPGDAVYGGLKAALIRSAESLALDLAPHGIRVNCVAPGAIQVRNSPSHALFYKKLGARIPLQRAGRPLDVARAVVWLASDEAGYITGTTLKVDGGLILPGMPERTSDADAGWGTPMRNPRDDQSKEDK